MKLTHTQALVLAKRMAERGHITSARALIRRYIPQGVTVSAIEVPVITNSTDHRKR